MKENSWCGTCKVKMKVLSMCIYAYLLFQFLSGPCLFSSVSIYISWITVCIKKNPYAAIFHFHLKPVNHNKNAVRTSKVDN